MTFININLVHKNLIKYIKIPEGPQKIHKGNVSRLGGLSIFASILLMSLININEEKNTFFMCFIISIPIFIFGFLEDFTQSISPKLRLLASVLSAAMFIFIFDKSIRQIGIEHIDTILNYDVLSIIFTLLCITYLIQAFNIIDGLNGLSLMTGIISLMALSIISYDIGEFESSIFLIYLIFILLGVLIFNFPFGKIFVGDSGAYIMGLYVAAFSITLAAKNISPFVIAQILIFPSYELTRSFVRRLIRDKKSILKPDKKHLHSILHTLNCKKYMLEENKSNFFSSSQIIFIQLLNLLYIIKFYNNPKMVLFGIATFIAFYEIIYYVIVLNIKNLESR